MAGLKISRGALNSAPEAAVRPQVTLTVVCMGFAMVIIDTTIVNVALPAIRDDFHTTLSTLQWVVDGYVVVLASLLLSGGALVDRLGAASMFRTGVVIFTVASALCGLAPSSGVLVAARLLQGVAAALLMPAAMALISLAYPDRALRAKALASFTTVAGSPQAFGPVLGGLLVSTIGWRSIFFLNLPVGVITLFLAARGGLPRSVRDPAHQADLPGQVLAIVMLVGLTGALIEGDAQGWDAPIPVAAASVAIVSAVSFVLRERSASAPLLPAKLVAAPGLARFVGIGLLLFTAYYGLVFVLSIYLQQTRHFSAFATGVQFLPSALPIFLLPVLTGKFVVRWGAQRMAFAGLVTAACGAMALLSVSHTGSPVALSVALALLGCGVGLTVGPQIALVLNAAPVEQSGIASGLLNAGRQTGTVLGVAVLGSIAGEGDRLTGMHFSAMVAAGLLGVGVLLTLSRRRQ